MFNNKYVLIHFEYKHQIKIYFFIYFYRTINLTWLKQAIKRILSIYLLLNLISERQFNENIISEILDAFQISCVNIDDKKTKECVNDSYK